MYISYVYCIHRYHLIAYLVLRSISFDLQPTNQCDGSWSCPYATSMGHLNFEWFSDFRDVKYGELRKITLGIL